MNEASDHIDDKKISTSLKVDPKKIKFITKKKGGKVVCNANNKG